MHFMSVQRIAAPRDFVFARAGEFRRLARALERRGAVVVPAAGPSGRPRYEVQYPFRDAMWPATLELQEMSAPEWMEVTVEGKMVQAMARFDFDAPEPGITQASMTVTIKPRNMQGRVLLGSMQVFRGRIQGRLDRDFNGLARAAERLWRKAGES